MQISYLLQVFSPDESGLSEVGDYAKPFKSVVQPGIKLHLVKGLHACLVELNFFFSMSLAHIIICLIKLSNP